MEPLFVTACVFLVIYAGVDWRLSHLDRPERHAWTMRAYTVNRVVCCLGMIISSAFFGKIGLGFFFTLLLVVGSIYQVQFKRTYYEGKFDELY
ncbi:hypothetical protein G4H71_16560 [Rhodococcus triatomae]|uniref:Uncharacterized protein n=1 Tax=Rhodococcus triatomae TaxID=300028 RepID=A0A1G8JR35_9NOCA|nr:hypothetical protein [Rhodococcus triatomae]QNG19656.1 hypothetical protein G4H72_13815 [Rhodococcus triatomae]QNG24429.1 hypothetical protein G4H71_16560 [Rhodococcus triatomae]SDI33571.1 hypothetical protein SAMN05444695_106262 [Rhodococcus triatomae]